MEALQSTRRAESLNRTGPGWPVLVAAVVLGGFAAFVLPFLLPVTDVPVFSTAWISGADNRAACVGLALVSVGVLLVTVWGIRRRSRGGSVAGAGEEERRPATEALGRGVLLAAGLLVGIWTLAWGFAIVRSGLRIAETYYFLEQTHNAAGIGLAAPMRIYRDLEFPYGPLLLEPAVWLWRVVGHAGVSIASCYVLTLTFFNVAGIWLVWFALNRLPMSGWARRLLFGVCCFEALHPLFGPNYSLTKFALPIALLVWGAGIASSVRRACALAAGLFVSIMVSPELGPGLSAGIAAMAVAGAVRSREPAQRRGWLLSLLAPAIGYAAFVMLYGAGFLDRLGQASAGALNTVIEPLPYTLVFCFAVAWMAPMAVGRGLASRREEDAGLSADVDQGPLLLGVFFLGLGLLPGALGRSDPLHVFFNGLPFLMLSMIGVERLSTQRRWVWAVAVVLLAVETQATNFHIYTSSLRAVLTMQRHPYPGKVDMGRLEADTGGEPVATPFLRAVPLRDELAMRSAHLFAGGRSPGITEIWDAEGERALIGRLRQGRWILMQAKDNRMIEVAPNDTRLKRIFRLGYRYPERHAPFIIGTLTEQEIASNWRVVDRFGDLQLYRRVR